MPSSGKNVSRASFCDGGVGASQDKLARRCVHARGVSRLRAIAGLAVPPASMESRTVVVGDLVEYWSSTHVSWLTTVVDEVNRDGFRLRGKSSYLAWDTQKVRAAQPGMTVGTMCPGTPPGGKAVSGPGGEPARATGGSAAAAGGSAAAAGDSAAVPGGSAVAAGGSAAATGVSLVSGDPEGLPLVVVEPERSRGTWDPQWGKLLDDAMAAHKTVANLLHSLHASYPSGEHMKGLQQMLVEAFPMTAAHQTSPFLGMPSEATMTGVVHPPRA